MEEILFDEILCEIFTRLPSSSSSSSPISSSLPSFESVPLVSKRWLRLYRASKTSMSLKFSPHDTSVITLLPSILNNHPSLSSLSISRGFTTITTPICSGVESLKAETIFNDELISIISSCCFNLRSLSFLINPVSSSSLVPLSTSLSLTSLSIELWKPQNSDFTWIALFSSLKELSIHVWSTSSPVFDFYPKSKPNPEVVELGLESISLFGIEPDDNDVTWLWKCCRKLKKLSLRSCGSIGEIEFFGLCLENLEEIELRTCRSIVDVVLLKVSEICESLKSLLIHDGGSKDGLVCFMNNARCYDTLERLDLRLPMDLTDDHLVSLAANFKCLSSISLTSCIFVTGFSLKALALSFSSSLEELSLLSCNAIERERGLLATIGQHLGRLRKLDLTRNEWLFDKEVVSMLASCNSLVEVVLRECKHLTGAVLVALNKNCVKLKTLDILSCRLIEPDDVEGFVMKTQCLKKLVVEENQITEAIVKLASSKLIETVVFPSLVW